MIIKSHIRGGFRAAAAYLNAQGQNEKIRTVEISDIEATNLDEAFENMRALACHTRAKKPLHHISINPFKDERLTDAQVQKIVERCEQKYGYKPGDHQRVIVEHIKDGRQHFHVMWSRISLTSGKAVWPGMHWNKSKQAAREMENELGLKRPTAKRMKRARVLAAHGSRKSRSAGRYNGLAPSKGTVVSTRLRSQRSAQNKAFKTADPKSSNLHNAIYKALPPRPYFKPVMRMITRGRYRKDENTPDSEKIMFRRPEWETAQLLAWAAENGRADVLAEFGIFSSEASEP